MHKLDLTAPQTPIIESTETAVDELPPASNNRDFTPERTSAQITNKNSMKKKNVVLGFCVAAILAGTATGYGSYRLYAGNTKSADSNTESAAVMSKIAGDNVKAGDVFGSSDTAAFNDPATGYLEAGGINGEGSHKLLRPGGDSQTVYLTSSVTDLDKLTGMEVKVWGETFKAQRAGWLMDVGRVEVIDVDGQAPVAK
ncbi:MAG: hypothetical protein GW947_01240 [Candidatus Pacebacteria bacterium]|nr:hypothetical protein [Candidatus Paceibacterota bacterium]